MLERITGRLGLAVSLVTHLMLALFFGGFTRPAVPLNLPRSTQVVMRLQSAVPEPVLVPPAPVPPAPKPPEPRPVKLKPPVPKPKPRPREPVVRKQAIPDPTPEPEPVEKTEPQEPVESPAPPQDSAPPQELEEHRPAAPPGPPVEVMDSVMTRQGEKDRLLSELLALIEQEKFYPFAARRLGINGQVELLIDVDETGHIRNYRVTSSSHGVFARSASSIMARVQRIVSRQALPNAKEYNLTVSLAFELNE